MKSLASKSLRAHHTGGQVLVNSSKSRKRSMQMRDRQNNSFHRRSKSNKVQTPTQNTNNSSITTKNQKGNKQQNQNEQTKKYLTKTLNILSHRFNIPSSVSGLSDKPRNQVQHAKANSKCNPTSSQSRILNLSTQIFKIVKDNIACEEQQTRIRRKKSSRNKQALNNYASTLTTNCYQTNNVSHQQPYEHRSVKIREQIIQQIPQKQNYRESVSLSKMNPSNSYSKKQNIMPNKISENQQFPNKEIHPARSNSAMGQHSQNTMINVSNSVLDDISSIYQVQNRSNSQLESYFRDKFGSNSNIQDDEQSVEKKLRVIKALKKTQEMVTSKNNANNSCSNRSQILTAPLRPNLDDVNDKKIMIEKLKGGPKGEKIQKNNIMENINMQSNNSYNKSVHNAVGKIR